MFIKASDLLLVVTDLSLMFQVWHQHVKHFFSSAGNRVARAGTPQFPLNVCVLSFCIHPSRRVSHLIQLLTPTVKLKGSTTILTMAQGLKHYYLKLY